MSKRESVKRMLSKAFLQKLKVDYVLMDSWFTCFDLLRTVQSLWQGKTHVIGRCKMDQTLYEVDGKKRNAQKLRLLYARRCHYCRKTKSSFFALNVKLNGIPVKLFLIRHRKHEQWTLLLATDSKLKYLEVFELYQIRWNIEVVWKECKQYLELGKYQGRDLDGQIADCALVFITHTILVLEKRFSCYQTIGGVFREIEKQVRVLTL